MNNEIIYHKIRVPTIQYGYIDFQFAGTADEAITEHDRLIKLYNGGFGLEAKEWNSALDGYLKSGKMTSDCYDAMSKEQQFVIQEIKKANKRK